MRMRMRMRTRIPTLISSLGDIESYREVCYPTSSGSCTFDPIPLLARKKLSFCALNCLERLIDKPGWLAAISFSSQMAELDRD
jgi:hypothetical protein